jgi:hypothetical protein
MAQGGERAKKQGEADLFFDTAQPLDAVRGQKSQLDSMDRPAQGALDLREDAEREYVEEGADDGEIFYDQAPLL